MPKKSNLFEFLFVCTIFLLMTIPAFAYPTVSIRTPVSPPTVGNPFDVFVDISAVSDIYSFQFDIAFDPALLSAVDITEGTLLGTGGASTSFFAGSIDNALGSISGITDTRISAVLGANGPGNLAIIGFNAHAPGISPITLSNLIIRNSSLNVIETTILSGSVAILTPPPSCTNGNCEPTPCTNGSCPAVPEPTTMLLLGQGLMGLAGVRRMLKK